ncbi:MAG: GntR family transcriptional regulator [Chitinophagaceae bacterium]|nr:GntR family transcriptional regulator [Chitinophagaceae bacterium]
MKALTLEKLQPIENQTQVDKIENSLQEYFRNGNFQPGDSIPKEIELSKALNVSRTSIREALSRFKTLGIIESKKNRGMLIKRTDLLYNMQKIVDLNLLDNATWKDIFELRLVLEIGISDLLFLRKTNMDLEKLEKIVMKDEQSKSKIEQKKYDVEFHSLLYEISGNDFIQRFQKMLFPFFNFDNDSLDVVGTDNNISHRDLLNALKNGTPEEFRNKMRGHLNQYFNKL